MNRKEYWITRRNEIREFRKLLDNHDWYYHQSHDSRRWEAGINEEKYIEAMIKNDYTFRIMYEARKRILTKKKK